MRILRYDAGQGPRHGEIEDGTVREWEGDLFGPRRRTGAARPLAEVRVLPPVVPSKFVLVSLNYEEVVTQLGYKRPPNPILFLKAPSAIVPDGGEIRYPAASRYVTFEPELVVVIGRECRRVPREQAMEHVLGYTCTNDVSARDIQDAEGQYTRCKSFDTFGPLGPAIVTDIDPSDLAVTGYLNGERRIETRSRNLIFDIPTLVAFTSECMTLHPGDLISTGASGVAEMRVGDTVSIEIEQVGRLTNRVVPW
jgi:2-keto-4-pentenoate hydratase/2-oxohepta-3-ene-1,7-dioic acid hydratase in catechol pathway